MRSTEQVKVVTVRMTRKMHHELTQVVGKYKCVKAIGATQFSMNQLCLDAIEAEIERIHRWIETKNTTNEE